MYFASKLGPVSRDSFKPLYFICPQSIRCQTLTCAQNPLKQYTRPEHCPQVTLIKDFTAYEDACVLSAHCEQCKTNYYADHERFPAQEANKFERLYLNTASFIKIGKNTWVDRKCSQAVTNGVYSFHASTAAYADFWNTTFLKPDSNLGKLSHRQVWQAFVQETVRTIATACNTDLTMADNLKISEVTRCAFEQLGQEGTIAAAHGHECLECTQPYKAKPDIIPTGGAARTNQYQPDQALGSDDDMDVDVENQSDPSQDENDLESIDYASVKMVVVDGIVVGPKVS